MARRSAAPVRRASDCNLTHGPALHPMLVAQSLKIIQYFGKHCHVFTKVVAEILRMPPQMKGAPAKRGSQHRSPDAPEPQAVKPREALIEGTQKPARRHVYKRAISIFWP